MKKAFTLLMTPFLFLSLTSCLEEETPTSAPDSSAIQNEDDLKLLAYNNSIYVGRSLALYSSLTDGVIFSSSNIKIASVDKNGVVKANKAGKATITATSPTGKKATVEINVLAYPEGLDGCFEVARTCNYTIEYSNSSYRYLDAYNVARIPLDSSVSPTGILQNGNQGLASFFINGNDINIDGFYGLGKVKSVLDVYGDSFSPLFSDASKWDETNKLGYTSEYRTTDENLISVFASLMNMSLYSSLITSLDLSMTVSNSRVSLYYSTTFSNQTYGFHINSIGSTSFDVLEKYLPVTKDVKERQEWNEQDLKSIEGKFDVSKIPFLTGSGFSLTVSAYENKLSISDFNNGDLSESYAKKLTELGWKDLGKKDSHMGYDEHTFSLDVSSSDKYAGTEKYTLSMHYRPNDILVGKEQKAFPNGKFELLFLDSKTPYQSESENEEELNAYLKAKAKDTFPAIDLKGKASKVIFEDVLEVNNAAVKKAIQSGEATEEDYYTFACYAEISIENEEDAKDVFGDYFNALVKKGFAYSEEYSIPKEYYYVYTNDRPEVGVTLSRADDEVSYGKVVKVFLGF